MPQANCEGGHINTNTWEAIQKVYCYKLTYIKNPPRTI